MKKLLCSLLVCVFMVLLVPTTVISVRAEEASGWAGEFVDWSLDSQGNLTISGWGDMYDSFSISYRHKDAIRTIAILPGVTSVSTGAFADCNNLMSVSFPETLTTIGANAFQGCSSLTSVTLPDNLTKVEEYTFRDCTGLKSLETSAKLEIIGEGAFYRCSSLSTLTLSEPLRSLADYAFWGCSSLSSVTFPSSLVEIGNWAFYNCSSLTTFEVAYDNTVYSVRDGVLYSMDGKQLLLCPFGKNGDVVLPQGLTAIPPWAFDGCLNITEFTIPASVTEIGHSAFSERRVPFNIYYEGSQDQWDAIQIDYDNNLLNYCTIYCNDTPSLDIDGDGCPNLKDVSRLYRVSIGAETLPLRTVDINRDGYLSLKDVALAYRSITEL